MGDIVLFRGKDINCFVQRVLTGSQYGIINKFYYILIRSRCISSKIQ